jgi:UDP-glucose 6-dehydrogenase
MRISVIGLGKLGLPVSCAMVQKGHEVFGFDNDAHLRDQYRDGVCGLYEPDMENVLAECLASGRLHIYDSLYQAVTNAEIIFVAVPTPSLENGAFDNGIVAEVLEDIANCLAVLNPSDYRVIAVISTVLPGTVRREFLPVLEAVLGPPGDKYGLCYNAQFIGMGNVIDDMLYPEFVLVGEYDEKSGGVLARFYTRLVSAPILRMSIENAEIVKVCYNTYIGFKIVIANAIMEVCDKVGHADATVVANALKKAAERIVSTQYMDGGLGDGGGCFPPGEIVITERGPVPIENVHAGDRVLTIDGTLQKVIGSWERNFNGELVQIKVRGLPRVRMTHDHRMIYAGDGRSRTHSGKRNTRNTITEELSKVREIQACNLTNDDLIPWPNIPNKHQASGIIDSDYTELAGWYLSEGHAMSTNRRGRISICLNGNRMKDAKRIGKLFMLVAPPPASGRGSDAKVSIIRRKNTIVVRYGSKRLSQRLIDDFGRGAPNKKIPGWLVYGPLNQAKLLMRGLWQGDGHTDENGMSLSTTSLNVAWSTFIILSRCGIDATLREIPERITSGNLFHRKAYQVDVRNKRFLKAMSEITGLEDKSPPQEKLYENYGYRDNATWRHVTEITTEPYKGPVYNLWVAGNNTYVVGCGAVHNCHPRDARALSYLADQLSLSYDPFGTLMSARDDQSRYLASVVAEEHERTGLPIAILGLTFKPKTNLTEDSPSLLLIDHIRELELGCDTYDPIIRPEPLRKKSYVYVLAMRHDELRDFDFHPGSVIIDPWRMLDKAPLECELRSIGRNV